MKTRSVQEESKKDQEHKILSWFSLPQGIRPVIFQRAKISTIQDHQDQFTTIQTLVTNKNTLLPTVNNLLNPSTSQTQCKNPLHQPNYNTLYNIGVANGVTMGTTNKIKLFFQNRRVVTIVYYEKTMENTKIDKASM